jgi:MFS family permease
MNQALLVAAIVQFGPHFAKNIAPLKVFFSADPGWHITATEWGLFQTAVTIPIALFPWLAGHSVDRNVRVKSMLTAALVITCVGQAVFTLACGDHIFKLALIGRFIFGIGEGLSSSLSGYVAVSYSPKYRMFAIGLMQALHALSVGMSKAIQAPIARYWGDYVAPLFASLFLCGVSLTAAITWEPERLPREVEQDTCESPRTRRLKICCQGPPGKLSSDFWTVAVMHMLIASSHRLFGHIDAAFLGSRFKRSATEAGYLSAVTELIAVFISPLLGGLLDIKRDVLTLPVLLLIATICGSVGYGMLAFSKRGFSLEIGIISISMVNAITPTVMKSVVPETVHNSVLATALGIYESSESLGVLVGSVLIGVSAARSGDDYAACIPLFAFLMLVAGTLAVTLVIRRNQKRSRGVELYMEIS